MSDSEEEEEEEIINTPQIIRETYTTWHSHKNPRLEHFKDIIRKNQGKNQIPLKDLEFYQEQILSQIPLNQITRKKVRDFVKAQKWKKVQGNDHEIFNHITNHDGNDYEHLEVVSLTTLNIFHWHMMIFTSTEKSFSIAIKFFSPC